MANEQQRELELLDLGQQASSRVLAMSSLLMGCREEEAPEAEDLWTVAHLIHCETEIMRDCIHHFRQAVKESELPPEP